VVSRSDQLLRDIETGALDSSTPIADVLRKVIALGGRAGSVELRTWAARELNGYPDGDELPAYRKITAPIHLDATMPFGGSVRGQQVSPLELPGFAREAMSKPIPLMHGIGELEAMVPTDRTHLQMQDQRMIDLVAYLNAHPSGPGEVMRLYYSVPRASLVAVVDRVRTALVTLVAEIQSNTPSGAEAPSAEVATHAVHVAINGQGHKVTVTAPQGGGSVATAAGENEAAGHWVKVAAGVILGLVAIVGVVFALMQVQGWRFGEPSPPATTSTSPAPFLPVSHSGTPRAKG
jgi:AbiTii